MESVKTIPNFDNVENKTLKKRGRPKKSEQQKVQLEPIIDTKTEEDIIVCLNLSNDDSPTKTEKQNAFNTTETITDEQSSDSSLSNMEEKNTKDLLNELKRKDIIIKKLQKKLKSSTANIEISASNEVTKTYLENKLFSIKDNKLILVEHTDIHCWWCTHQFDTLPCFIPDRFNNETYFVFGCFCSLPCAMAYNLSMSDQRVAIRHGLLRKLYLPIFKIKTIPIAPQRELLKTFGGTLTIEKFRDVNLMIKRDIYTILPPMIPLIPIIEEINHDNIIESLSG